MQITPKSCTVDLCDVFLVLRPHYIFETSEDKQSKYGTQTDYGEYPKHDKYVLKIT